MKGLICYASFCVANGTKKGLTLSQVKGGFFVPGDTADVQREPFSRIAVAGESLQVFQESPCIAPATVRFFIGLIVRIGRFALHPQLPGFTHWAGLCLYRDIH